MGSHHSCSGARVSDVAWRAQVSPLRASLLALCYKRDAIYGPYVRARGDFLYLGAPMKTAKIRVSVVRA